MKRKETFRQHAIRVNDALNQQPLSKEDEDRAKADVFPAQLIERTYYKRRIAYCSECGHQAFLDYGKCPHCGAEFKAEMTKEHRWEAGYQAILEAVDGLQVVRFVMVKRYTFYCKPTVWQVSEVMRHIYNDQGERYVFSKNVQGLSMYYDAWCCGSPISLKQEAKRGGYYNRALKRQNIDVFCWHLKSLTRQWQYKPIEDIMAQGDTFKLRILALPCGEMMMKCGYMSVFNYCVQNYRLLSEDEQTALRICHRNHYEIRDVSLWLDYIGYLTHFGLDVHNAHYVCPADLRQAHQALYYRKERERIARMTRAEAERATRLLEERMEKDKKFADMMQHWAEHMGAILSLSLNGDNISIKPLQSIEEFKREGEAMHHCVYSNAYYDYTKKPYCLILSARDSEGRRLATIEYNTQRHDIVQCRAACNQVPERDKEIRQLITDHRKDIEALLRQKEVATKGRKLRKAKAVA